MKRKREKDDLEPPLKYPRLNQPSESLLGIRYTHFKPSIDDICVSFERDGKTCYLECEKENLDFYPKFTTNGCLGEDIDVILKRVREKRFQKKINKENELLVGKPKKKKDFPEINFNQLLVDKYRPENYLDLLTEDRINLQVLEWVKKWEPIVFPHKPYDKMNKYAKFGPRKKFLLLSGSPGIGKTTLAHVIAKTAGYEPVEINASDDRSKKRLVGLINNISQKKNVFFHKSTMEREKPKLLILDEIDGAAGRDEHSAVQSLVQSLKIEQKKNIAKSKQRKKQRKKPQNLFGGGHYQFGKKKKKKIIPKRSQITKPIITKKRKKRKTPGGRKSSDKHIQKLRIPTILICNNPFLPFLRELRMNSEFVHFETKTPGSANRKVIDRLVEICQNEKIKFNRSIIKNITESFGNDIRSCLNYLQFYLINQYYWSDLPKNKNNKDESIKDELNELKRAYKDVRKFKKDILENIFEKRSRGESIRDMFFNFASEMGNRSILESCFQNYPRMRYTDIDFQKTCFMTEFMSLNDTVTLVLRKTMQFTLSYFMIVTLVCIKIFCQTPFQERVVLKSENYELFQASQRKLQILESFRNGMNPKLQKNYNSKANLVLDLLPVARIILNPPAIRRNMNSVGLLSQVEKDEVAKLVGLHKSFGSSYIRKVNFLTKREYYQLTPDIYNLVKPFRMGSQENQIMKQPWMKNKNSYVHVCDTIKYEIPFGIKSFLSRYTGENKNNKLQNNSNFKFLRKKKKIGSLIEEEDEEEENDDGKKKKKIGLSVDVKRITDQYKNFNFGKNLVGGEDAAQIMSPMSPIENQFNFHSVFPPMKKYCRFIYIEGSTKAVRTKAKINEF